MRIALFVENLKLPQKSVLVSRFHPSLSDVIKSGKVSYFVENSNKKQLDLSLNPVRKVKANNNKIESRIECKKTDDKPMTGTPVKYGDKNRARSEDSGQ